MGRSDIDFEELTGLETPASESVENSLRRVMVTGAAITLPVIVTLIVLGFVLNLVSNLLAPLVSFLQDAGIATSVPEVVTQAIAIAVLVGAVFVVGFVGESRKADRIGDTVEALIEGIPGVGSVYTSFNRVSEVLLDSDTQSFQELKLVEFPHEGSYVLAFLTADSPEPIEDAAGEGEMLTLFVPLAPNPVMGGFLVNMPVDQVHDVDLTVEEGVRAIVTSGVAVGDFGRSLDPEDLAALTEDERPSDIPEADPERVRAYARNVGAGHVETPEEVADRRDDGWSDRPTTGDDADSASGKPDRGEGPDG